MNLRTALSAFGLVGIGFFVLHGCSVSTQNSSSSSSSDATSGAVSPSAIPEPAATGESKVGGDSLFTVKTQSSNNGVTFVFYKLSELPTTIEVALPSSTNLTATHAFPISIYTGTLSSGTPLTISALNSIDNTQAWNYRWTTQYVFGVVTSTLSSTLNFKLPFEEGKSYPLAQGYNGSFSHQSTTWNNLSLDFDMSELTPIHAAHNGIVSHVYKGATTGGLAESFKDKANYVSLVHTDGTITQYVHLHVSGVLVTLGQPVSRGEKIGLSGNTGYSSGPHLHFHGYRHQTMSSSKTVTLSLMTQSGLSLSLATNTSYTSTAVARSAQIAAMQADHTDAPILKANGPYPGPGGEGGGVPQEESR